MVLIIQCFKNRNKTKSPRKLNPGNPFKDIYFDTWPLIPHMPYLSEAFVIPFTCKERVVCVCDSCYFSCWTPRSRRKYLAILLHSEQGGKHSQQTTEHQLRKHTVPLLPWDKMLLWELTALKAAIPHVPLPWSKSHWSQWSLMPSRHIVACSVCFQTPVCCCVVALGFPLSQKPTSLLLHAHASHCRNAQQPPNPEYSQQTNHIKIYIVPDREVYQSVSTKTKGFLLYLKY